MRNLSISNFMTNTDNIIFNFIFDMVWVIYMINIIAGNVNNILDILVLKFFLTSILSFVSFALSLSVSERWREEIKMIFYMPLQSLYSGYFLRITRIIATMKELFFFSSYRDEWNPAKSSMHARNERM